MVNVIRIFLHTYSNELFSKSINSIRNTCNCEPKVTLSKIIPNYALIEVPATSSVESIVESLKEVGIDDFKVVLVK